VTDIQLDDISMRGTIPPTITRLNELKELKLKRTGGLSGTLPANIGTLNALEDVIIGRNKLSGTLPDSFYALGELERLYLKQTRVSGTISEAIGMLTNLRSVEVEEADFEGTLPKAITSLRRLTRFKIEDNAWRGWLPQLPAGITDCQLTDKTFSTPYESRVATPVKWGFGITKQNAQFNCPLPSFMPEECASTVYCSTDPKKEAIYRDCAVLTDMYNSMGAPWQSVDWRVQSKGKAPKTCCDWQGVVCKEEGGVLRMRDGETRSDEVWGI